MPRLPSGLGSESRLRWEAGAGPPSTGLPLRPSVQMEEESVVLHVQPHPSVSFLFQGLSWSSLSRSVDLSFVHLELRYWNIVMFVNFHELDLKEAISSLTVT